MKAAIRILVSAAILAALFVRFGVADIVGLCLRASRPELLLAFGVYLVSQLLSALRWRELAHGVGFRVGLARYARFYLVGMFFGLVVPSTIGSDAARTLYLGASPPGRAQALSSVVCDRVVGLIVLVGVAVAAMALGPSNGLPDGLEAMVIAVGAILVAGWLSLPAVVKLLPPEQRWRRLVEDELLPYFRDPRLLGVASLLSLVVHGLQIVSQQLLTRALRLDVPFGFVAIYHPLVSLAAAIPITIGGFGLREAAYAYLLPYEGIGPDDAIALGLLWWAVGAAGALLGGAVYALPGTEALPLRSSRRPATAGVVASPARPSATDAP